MLFKDSLHTGLSSHVIVFTLALALAYTGHRYITVKKRTGSKLHT